MNRLVNIPILACRRYAGKGDKEAAKMWDLWANMVQISSTTNYKSTILTVLSSLKEQAAVSELPLQDAARRRGSKL